MHSNQAELLESRSDSQDSFDIDPLSSEFVNDATEASFLAHALPATQPQLRSALFFCAFFYLAFALTDIAAFGFSRDTSTLNLARIAVAVTAMIGCWLTTRLRHSVPVSRMVATVVAVAGLSTFMLAVIFRPQELAWHAMSKTIMLFVVYVFIPNRLAYSLVVNLCASGVFIFLAVTVGQLKPPEQLTLTMLLLLGNTFGLFAARRNQCLWREAFRTQTSLTNLSTHDHLTGCFNRRYLQEKLFESEIFRAQRYHQCLSVIMCDLDNFKIVNDNYGHHGGDAVLRDFSELLRNMTRKQIDSIVRYGGEEFLLILPETDLREGVLLAERLRHSFAASDTAHGANDTIRTTASFGVATFDFALSQEVITLDSLIASADDMLYLAKSGGRNQVKCLQLP